MIYDEEYEKDGEESSHVVCDYESGETFTLWCWIILVILGTFALALIN